MSSGVVALDVGERRIGVAIASGGVKIAVEWGFVEVDGEELRKIRGIVEENGAELVVIGRPRNQSGEVTAQTRVVEGFAEKVREFVAVEFQDESLTSVLAEKLLKEEGRAYEKGDVDARAAALILQDYLEVRR
ncbi:Holliday junction resolvase RuvX [Candidatus Saccharibacteria bacterium]|nr:Holliday junction resolvase RuvX [Candidatus Saccharibacteria bacterium]